MTTFTDVDVTFPAAGPSDIVFQAGGRLYLLNVPSEKLAEVPVKVVTDEITLKPRAEKVAPLIETAGISPTGKRGVFAARGDVFTVPAEHGPVMNLTRSSGVAERYPSWSPDGSLVAYWSDRTGEYQLTVRPADGTGAERTLTTLGPGFRYRPQWSPDSKRLAFVDEQARIYVIGAEGGVPAEIDRSRAWMGHDALEGLRFAWSADSRWIAWSRPASTGSQALFLYDTAASKLTQATSGYFSDLQPVFDPEGKYLYYLSNRAFTPMYGDFDNSWTYANSTQIVAVPLRTDVASPLAARNDVEPPKDAPRSRHEGRGEAGVARRTTAGRPARPSARRTTPRRTSRRSPSRSRSKGSRRAPSSCRSRPGTTPTCSP